jgi:phenylacetate-CoA ligase
MFRFRRWYGVDIGAYEATFRGTNFPPNVLRKLKVKDFLLNRQRISERNLSKENLDRYYRSMCRAKPETFYGFPTLIEKFTDHLIRSGIEPKPFPSLKCIIPTSEMAYPWQEVKWQDYYGVPVADEYGCTEAGIMAVECPHGCWHVPVESCLVEYIPLENATNGESPYKIIVTDLMNRAMPIIRYDVGDSAMPGDQPCACGRGLPTMKSFAGRVAKLIDLPDGRTIHSLDFYYIFRKAGEIKPDGIKEFQIRINYPKEFEIYIVPGTEFNDEIMDFLKHKISYALGNEAEITYKLVDEIIYTQNGKYDKIVMVNNADKASE